MVALRVTLNGKVLCTAGADDLAVVNTIVGAVGNLGPRTKRSSDHPAEIYFSVAGLTARAKGSDEHFGWVNHRPLKSGDTVEVEILDTDVVDPPSKKGSTETPEERERLRFEDAKKVYFSLRSKFETE